MPCPRIQPAARVLARAIRCVCILAAVLAAAAPAGAVPIEVTVMTRNLYFGADTTAIFSAPNANAIPPAVKSAFAQGKANDFNLRVEGIADEIQRSNPHLIGLQEAVSLNSVSAATGALTYSRDFVQILVSELASRGLNYQIAVTHTGSSTILPSGNSLATIEEFVTLTDREVILRRSDVAITGTKEATFINSVTLPFAGGSFAFNSGYVAVDAVVNGASFRFVSTHLDPLLTPLQPLQFAEVLAATGDAQRLVVVGDLNSAADGSSTPTYANALAAGLRDVWSELGGGLGFTCCQSAALDNPVSLLDTRIDYILFRGGLDPLGVDLLGDVAFRDVAPLYASDHAGLVAIFAINVVEPGTLLLVGVGGLGWWWGARRRRVTGH